MPRLSMLLTFLALAAASCGGSSGPGEILSETAENLGEIESGTLSMRMAVTSDGAVAGFELDGPFALPENGNALPVAEMEYTQLAGDEEVTVTFISAGEKAFVQTAEETFELPAAELDGLRGTGGVGSLELEELRIGDWFENPRHADGGEVGGVNTDRIRSDLDVVAAANDLIELASALGAPGGARLEGTDAEQLERAIRSATVEVYTGDDDRLLRRLTINAELGAEVPAELRPALEGFAGAEFELELEIANPNESVEVEEPTDVEPLPGS